MTVVRTRVLAEGQARPSTERDREAGNKPTQAQSTSSSQRRKSDRKRKRFQHRVWSDWLYDMNLDVSLMSYTELSQGGPWNGG